MTRWIDLSCDLGEARTDAERAVENAIWPMITSANVACGGHVGDERSMNEAIDRCAEFGVALGGHPSFPDREGFGRRHIEIGMDELVASITSQLMVLRELSMMKGFDVERVKPHGALYNEAQVDGALARAIVRAVRQATPSAAIVCASGSEVERACREGKLSVVREAFVDRRYRTDGTLQPRSEEGALIESPDAAASQALRLAEANTVTSCDGASITISFETLCAHSDMAGSVERISRVREALSRAGFQIGRKS